MKTLQQTKEAILKEFDEYTPFTVEIDDYDITGHDASHTELDFDKVRIFLSQVMDRLEKATGEETTKNTVELLTSLMFHYMVEKGSQEYIYNTALQEAIDKLKSQTEKEEK